MRLKGGEIRECGVCGGWTSEGDSFPSSNRDPRTGQTPMDNFICDRCQREARMLREINGACDRRERARQEMALRPEHKDRFPRRCAS
jgi:hypothetical protein